MESSVWIQSVEFINGTKVEFSKEDIVVFVGPNNAGKSASLKEMESLVKSKHRTGKIIKEVTLESQGNEKDLLELVKSSASIDLVNNNFNGYKFSIHSSVVQTYWLQRNFNGLGELASIFVNSINTEQRLMAANPPQSIRLTTEAMKHPIHFLQKQDEIEERFSQYFKQAFGLDLVVHRNAGSEVPLYVGNRPIPKAGEDRVSMSYISELEKLDLLHEQGDGMRGFVGVLLNAFVSNYSILFLDEPEAFLHPPQARLLGKMLAKDRPNERQLFLATHSENFLKGLLDSNVKNLKIIRLQRSGDQNSVSILNSKDINNVWNDSLLRHSNILDGLFHSKVIICESDSDSRFYSAVLSSVYDNVGGIAPDVLFINCGGKHRIHIAIKALKKLNVPIKVIADFDVLNDINPLKEIIESLGGTWIDIASDWKTVKQGIETKKPELLSEDVKEEIKKIIDSVTDKIFPKQKTSDIQNVLKKIVSLV